MSFFVSGNQTPAYASIFYYSAGSGMVLSADLLGNPTDTYSIGTSGNKMKDAYFSGTVTAATFSGAMSATSSTATTAFTLDATAIGETAISTTKGVFLNNGTAATNTVDQYSPSLRLRGRFWDTGTSASKTRDYYLAVAGDQGNPAGGELYVAYSDNGGAAGNLLHVSGVWNQLVFDSNLSILWTNDNQVDIGGSGANRPRTVYAGTSVVTPTVTAATAVTGPAITASTLLSTSTTAIGENTSLTKGLLLDNTSASTVSVGQYSPTLIFRQHLWDTVPGGDVTFDWYIHSEGDQGNPPSGKLRFMLDAGDGGGIRNFAQFASAGASGHFFTLIAGITQLWSTDGGGDVGAYGGNRPDYVHAKTGFSLPTTADPAGSANHVTYTGTTLAIDAGEGSATLGKMPTGGTEAQDSWLKLKKGTATYAIPIWVIP